MAAFRLGRGHQIEAGGAGVAGLDAVDALDLAEQAVMPADRAAAVLEGAHREQRVVFREAFLDGAGENGEVARRRQVRRGMRQAVRIVEAGRAHPERARLARHLFGEGLLGTGDVLGNDDRGIIGRERDHALDHVFDRDGRAGAQAELGRRLRGRVGRDLELGIHGEAAALHLLEQHVERHDLGQRGRDARSILVDRMQGAAGLRVDHHRGIGRV